MKKFNWGHGILVFFILYVSTLGMILYRSFQVDHSLVAQDYYAKDLAYQAHYDRVENFRASGHELEFKFQPETEEFQMSFSGSEEKVAGTLTLYHPVKASGDIRWDFTLRPNQQVWLKQLKNVRKGRWIAKVEYETGGRKYYFEKELYFKNT